jgi:hypothetical protein
MPRRRKLRALIVYFEDLGDMYLSLVHANEVSAPACPTCFANSLEFLHNATTD